MFRTKKDFRTEEEFERVKGLNFDLVQALHPVFMLLKDFKSGYGNAGKGIMLLEYKGKRYRLDVEALPDIYNEGTFDDAFDRFKHRWKD